MKRYVMIFAMAMMAFTVKAQIFRFGFGDDFFNDDFFGRQRQPQEQIIKPEYDGDKEDMEDFMKENFKSQPGQQNVEGKIVIACIIDEKGKVVETHVVRGLSEPLNKEAKRVAEKMKFKPAKKGKDKVKSRYDVTFPIRRGRVNFLDLETIDV